jgi:WASH complex subunit strumpellin
VFFNR